MKYARFCPAAGGLALLAAVLCGCGGGSGAPAPRVGEEPEEPVGDQFIVEEFLDLTNRDAAASDADWGGGEVSVLRGQPVTSRTEYVFAYPETDAGPNSGRGQYIALSDLLVGSDQGPFLPPYPATNLGRRVLFSIADTQLGAGGAITGVGWGPDGNQTVAASYPNLKMRLGYLDQDLPTPPWLGDSIGASYADAPTLVYDGTYDVPQSSVANTPGHPASTHTGGYAQGFGCLGNAAGWNAPLFNSTGFFDYPTPTTLFEWDPGDPQVDNDSVLLLDVSVQEGDFSQTMRGWIAFTFPCSLILIGGYPEQRLNSVYESEAANPAQNFVAGVINPAPVVTDTCITFSRRKSIGQSKFFEGAFGDDTDYQAPVLVPAAQPGEADTIVEYQGADAVEADRVTIDENQPFTAWTTDIDQCDGMKYLRFRICLLSDLESLQVARVDKITIGMTDLDP